MLDFCTEHGIASEGEIIPAEQLNHAGDRVTDLMVYTPGSQTV